MVFYTEPRSARRFTLSLEGHPRLPRASRGWHRDSLALRLFSPCDPSTPVKSAAASKSSILFVLIHFRTLLRPPNSQPPSFQSFARSFPFNAAGRGTSLRFSNFDFRVSRQQIACWD